MWPFSKNRSIADSGVLRGLTDYHSHVLSGVDDGAGNMDESLGLLKAMEQQGVNEVWLTPHVMEDFPNKTDDLRQKFKELKATYSGNITLKLAAEYMIDHLFDERLAKNDLLPIGDNGRFLLVETSYFSPPIELLAVFDRIRAKGYYPLLAHPERYEYMRMEDYKLLKEKNVSFQLNLPALAGLYGKGVQEKAEQLLKRGFYNFTGSDIHTKRNYSRMTGASLSSGTISAINRTKEQAG